MCFVWRVPLKVYSTFSAVLRNLIVNLPLKQIFVTLSSAMTPFVDFHYCTLYILPRCAFWAIKRRDTFLLCRDIPVNVQAGNPHWRHKNEGFLGDNSPMGYRWDPQKAHPWPKPRRLMHNMWDSSARRRLCACPRSHWKKTPPVDNFAHSGGRDPRLIIMNFGLLGGHANVINCTKVCFDRLRGFCSAGCWKWPFPIPRLHVIY
jgi:hypothetical protein